MKKVLMILTVLLLSVVTSNAQNSINNPSQGGGGGFNTLMTVYGARCDGVTDDSIAIQNLINSQTSIGGRADLPTNVSCVFSSPIVLKSNVSLYLNGSKLKWSGSTSSAGLITTDSTLVANRIGIYGGNGIIDIGTCSTCTVFNLHSFEHGIFRDFMVMGPGSASNIIFHLKPDSSSGTGAPSGVQNIANSLFDNIEVWTPFGNTTTPGTSIGLWIDGISSSNQGVYQMKFHDLSFWGVSTRGVKVTQWSDNVRLDHVTVDCETSGCIGFALNDTATPATYAGVNSYILENSLVVGNGGVGGRIALKTNAATDIWASNFGSNLIETVYDTTNTQHFYLCGNADTEQINCQNGDLNLHGTWAWKDPSATLILGSQVTPGTDQIKFRSSGTAADFDSLIFGALGDGTPAGGYLFMRANGGIVYRDGADTDRVQITPGGLNLVDNVNGLHSAEYRTLCTANASTGATIAVTSCSPIATSGIPVALILGVSCKVTTAFSNASGLTTFSIGIPGHPTYWGTGISRAAGTQTGVINYTLGQPFYNTVGVGILLTADAGTFNAAAGTIVCAVTYRQM